MGVKTDRIMQEMREKIYGPQQRAIDEGQSIGLEVAAASPLQELDAKECGEHVRSGGWRIGLLVSRNVRPGEYQKPFRPKPGEKMSFGAFARLSGLSARTVRKYLETWNAAAAEGVVPASQELAPGQEIVFDSDLHTHKSWAVYFKEAARPFSPSVWNRARNANMSLEKFLAELDSSSFASMDHSPQEVRDALSATAANAAAALVRLDLVVGQMVADGSMTYSED